VWILLAIPVVIIVVLMVSWNSRWKRRYEAAPDCETQAQLKRQRFRYFSSSGTWYSKGDKLFKGRDD
jgi:hypothetical protein